MARKTLSLLLSCALLLTCFGGVTLGSVAAVGQNEPYVWFRVDENGQVTGNCTAIIDTKTNTAATPVALPEVGGYGFKLDTTSYWNRLDITFDASGLPTDGREVTLEMDYYITSGFTANDNWPVMGFANGNGTVPQSANLFTKSFKNKQVATFTYTYSATDIATIQAKGAEARIMLLPDDVARQGMWIKSMRIVAAEESGGEEPGGEEPGGEEAYAWFDTEGGTVTGNCTAIVDTATGAASTPVAIPEAGGYGFKLDTTSYWNRLDITFDASGLPTDGRSVVLEIEYYIGSDFTASENWPVLGLDNGNGTAPQNANLFTGSFKSKQVATFTYTYSATDIATIRARGTAAKIRILPDSVARQGMWIKSMRIVDGEGPGGEGPGGEEPGGEGPGGEEPGGEEPGGEEEAYVWFDTEGGTVTGNCTAIVDTSTGAASTPVAIPGVGGYGFKLDTNSYWNRLDISFDASCLPTDGRSITLKMEYYIAAAFTANDNWAVLGFDNGNGNAPQSPNLFTGAFKSQKVATFTYTYSAEDIETMREKGTAKIRLLPGDVARMGMYIKSIRLVDTPVSDDQAYAWFDTADGEITGNCTAIINTATGAPAVPVEIPEVGGYGFKLDTNSYWNRLDISFDASRLPADGRSVTLIMEYYIATNFTINDNWPVLGFDNGNGNAPQAPNLFTINFDSKKIATFTHTYSAEDIETMRQKGTAKIRLLPGDVARMGMYIKSMRLVDTPAPEEQVGPYVWFDVSDSGEITGNYKGLLNAGGEATATKIPEVGGYGIKLDTTDYWKRMDVVFDASRLPADGSSMTLVLEIEYYLEAEFGPADGGWRVLGLDNGNGNAPLSANLLTKHFESRKVAVFTHIYSAEDIEAMRQKGVAKIRLFPDSVARQGMYIKSLSLMDLTDKIALQEYVDKTAEFTRYKTPASVAEYNKVVEAAKAVLANKAATKEMFREALAALEAARELLVDCPHDCGTKKVGYVEPGCTEEGYSGDDVCKDCGFLAEENRGSVLPPYANLIVNQQEPSCSEKGYSGDLWCTKHNRIEKSGYYTTELPHNWGDSKVTKPATKHERGEITKTCIDCSETEIFYYDFTPIKGDASGDGAINNSDAHEILRFAVGNIPGEALDVDMSDVNGDGVIDTTDARLVLQLYAGVIKKFPTV